jgi:hypothetical protein
MLELFLVLIIGLLLVGIVYWVAAMLLPHPIPQIVAVLCLVILLLWLVGSVDTSHHHVRLD